MGQFVYRGKTMSGVIVAASGYFPTATGIMAGADDAEEQVDWDQPYQVGHYACVSCHFETREEMIAEEAAQYGFDDEDDVMDFTNGWLKATEEGSLRARLCSLTGIGVERGYIPAENVTLTNGRKVVR
jgi:hypothetical protein